MNGNPPAAAAPAGSGAGGPPPPPLSALLADALLEFLEAAVHTVLHARGLYPAELFERRRIYGSCLCPRARHPGVCAYVASALAALRGPLLRGALQEVAVVVLPPPTPPPSAPSQQQQQQRASEGAALEKVSFVLHRWSAQQLPQQQQAAGGGGRRGPAPAPAPSQAVPLLDAAALEASFAAALVKLQYLSQAPPLQLGQGGGGGQQQQQQQQQQQHQGGGGATPPPRARPLPRGATWEVVGLATSREGVDRSLLMEEDVLEQGPGALLLPSSSPGGGAPPPAGWPLKTIRLDGGGGGGGASAAAAAAAATLTIVVEAQAQGAAR